MEHEDDFRNLLLHENKLRELIRSRDFPEHEGIMIEQALALAKEAHGAQKRDDGDPYVIHPIRTANILLEDIDLRDADAIAAALLHDVVEDTNVTLEQIKEQFGDHVARLVDGVTRDKDGGESKAMETQKIIQGPMDIRLIKAADKLDNLRSYPLRTDRGDRWKRHLMEARTLFPVLARSTENPWMIQAMDEAYELVPDKELEFQTND